MQTMVKINMEVIIYFLIYIVRTILTRIAQWTKISKRNESELKQKINNQNELIKKLASENRVLNLKADKFKLAVDNLLQRSELQVAQIMDLESSVECMEMEKEKNIIQINQLNEQNNRKGRDLFRMKIKLDMLKLQLQID